MAGYTTESKRPVNATCPMDADDGLGSDVEGPEASWNLCWSLGSIFSCKSSIDGLGRPKGLASTWPVDAPFFPTSAVDGFDSDSSFILTVLLVDGSRSS